MATDLSLPIGGNGKREADLDDFGVCKDLIENLQLVAPRLQRIDDPVFFARADLHQTDDAIVGSKVVMLEVDGNLLGLLELRQHVEHGFVRVDPRGGSLLGRLVGNRGGGSMDALGILRLRDLRLVRALVSSEQRGQAVSGCVTSVCHVGVGETVPILLFPVETDGRREKEKESRTTYWVTPPSAAKVTRLCSRGTAAWGFVERMGFQGPSGKLSGRRSKWF